jgi:hypothetical protein
MPSAAERQLLLAPDVVARAAASMAPAPEQQWMLRQSRALRRSYAEEVFGQPDEELAGQAWMLRQSRKVRLSYLDEVVSRAPDTPLEMRWMLRQDDDVCASYVDEVLLAG